MYHTCACVYTGVHMSKPLNLSSFTLPWNDSVSDSLTSVTTASLSEHMLFPSPVVTGAAKGVFYEASFCVLISLSDDGPFGPLPVASLYLLLS